MYGKSYILAFPYEEEIPAGAAVVMDSGTIKLPGENGQGLPFGLYSGYEAADLTRPGDEASAPVTLSGPAWALASGEVKTGQWGVAAPGGALTGKDTPEAGDKVYGRFLADGAEGELVDFLVSPFAVPAGSGT